MDQTTAWLVEVQFKEFKKQIKNGERKNCSNKA